MGLDVDSDLVLDMDMDLGHVFSKMSTTNLYPSSSDDDGRPASENWRRPSRRNPLSFGARNNVVARQTKNADDGIFSRVLDDGGWVAIRTSNLNIFNGEHKFESLQMDCLQHILQTLRNDKK